MRLISSPIRERLERLNGRNSMNLSDLGERIWALLSRGRVTGADGNKPMRTLQLELLASDARDNIEHMEPYGFTLSLIHI